METGGKAQDTGAKVGGLGDRKSSLVIPLSQGTRQQASHEDRDGEKVVAVFRGYELLIEKSGSENGLWTCHKKSRLHSGPREYGAMNLKEV